MRLIRAIWNYYFGSCRYGVWQCCDLEHKNHGAACQRFKGHLGKHRGYQGEIWP